MQNMLYTCTGSVDHCYVTVYGNDYKRVRLLEREVRGSNLGPVKSDTVLPTVRHRCDISSKGAMLPVRNDAKMDPANSLHASVY